MTLRKILAFLITAVLVAGTPALAAAEIGAPDCVLASGVSADGGCCNDADHAKCIVACLASQIAAVDRLIIMLAAASDSSPLMAAVTRMPSLSWPPVSPPPKTFSL